MTGMVSVNWRGSSGKAQM